MKKHTLFAAILSAVLMFSLTSCGNKNTTENPPQTDTSTSTSEQSLDMGTPPTTSESSAEMSNPPSAENPPATTTKEISKSGLDNAIASLNSTYPNSKLTEVEIHMGQDGAVYKVEGADGTMENTVIVQSDGVVVSNNQKPMDAEDKAKLDYKSFTMDGVINPEDAVKNAIARIDGVVQKVSLEKDDGVLVYEVSILVGTEDWDIKMDAKTGNVIKIDD